MSKRKIKNHITDIFKEAYGTSSPLKYKAGDFVLASIPGMCHHYMPVLIMHVEGDSYKCGRLQDCSECECGHGSWYTDDASISGPYENFKQKLKDLL